MKASDFFSLPNSLAQFAPIFRPDAPPWEWLKQITAALATVGDASGSAKPPAGVHVEGKVWIHPSVTFRSTATIFGPTWIGPNCDIRPNAYIRGSVIVGEGCVL